MPTRSIQFDAVSRDPDAYLLNFSVPVHAKAAELFQVMSEALTFRIRDIIRGLFVRGRQSPEGQSVLHHPFRSTGRVAQSITVA